MTRNQEICQAASRKVNDMLESNMELDMRSQIMYQSAFTSGAKWVDEHPHWHLISEKPEKYDDYIVITKGNCIDSAHFNIDGWSKSEYDGSTEFKYWIEFPNKPDGL